MHVLSSDSSEILNAEPDFPVFRLNRPIDLAQDDSPTLPALQHAVFCAEYGTGITFDYIIELRVTSPLRTTQDIDTALELLVKSDADSVISVCEDQAHHPARMKWLDNSWIRSFQPEPANGQRHLLLPKAYIRNGAIYAFPRKTIMGPEPKLFNHDHSLAYIMPKERSVNIDTYIDLLLAETIMKRDNKCE